MIKYSSIVLFLVLFFVGCAEDEEKILPEGILSEEQMVDAIVVLELNQAMYKLELANADTVNFVELITEALEKQETTVEGFNTSLDYYAAYPDKVMSFYDQAIVILTEKQAALQPLLQKKED